jgi:hypothetical protein
VSLIHHIYSAVLQACESDVADILFRYNVPVQISTDEKVKGRVNGSVEFLKQHLEKGEVVYG